MTYFIGLLFVSGAMGTIFTAPIGCLVFGVGLMGCAMVMYLDGTLW